MKKQESIQIKGLDIKELKLKAKTIREEIANLVLDKNIKKLKDLKSVSKKKKELAQILTVIRQKELLSQIESRVLPAGRQGKSQESSKKAEEPEKKKEEKKGKNK